MRLAHCTGWSVPSGYISPNEEDAMTWDEIVETITELPWYWELCIYVAVVAVITGAVQTTIGMVRAFRGKDDAEE